MSGEEMNTQPQNKSMEWKSLNESAEYLRQYHFD